MINSLMLVDGKHCNTHTLQIYAAQFQNRPEPLMHGPLDKIQRALFSHSLSKSNDGGALPHDSALET